MKKTLFFATFAVLGLASCKKDYTCTCRVNGAAISTTTIKDTKKNAESKCNEGDATISLGGVSISTDCSI